nr:hypothetical protein [Allobaculum stercoricanis]
MKLYFPSLQLRIDWLLTNPQDQEDLELMHQKERISVDCFVLKQATKIFL